MKTPDAKLIKACRGGDGGAWARLIRQYERLVFSIPLNYGLSREDAADITQITFTILMQSLDNLADDSNLGGWLSTVARRHTWRLMERGRRESASEIVETADEARMLLGKSPSDTVEHWELVEWLNGGLSLVSEACRDLLTALYFDPAQPSYNDIAASLGVSVGSIGPTRARCLQKLRQALQEDG